MGTLLHDLHRLNSAAAAARSANHPDCKGSLQCEIAASKTRDERWQQQTPQRQQKLQPHRALFGAWQESPQPQQPWWQQQLQQHQFQPPQPQHSQFQQQVQQPQQPSLPQPPQLPHARSRNDQAMSQIPCHASCDFVDQHYTVIRELGRGSFSHVKLVRERRTGHERVCKYVSTEQMTSDILEMARTEIRALASLDHPSIVRLYEYAEDQSRQMLVLVLEYIAGGDCSDLLRESENSVNEATVARLIYQLLVATNCCHTRGVIHRDIKPQNLMLAKGAEPWGGIVLKLIDFGLAVCAERSRDLVGTPAYLPPEVLSGTSDYTSKVDIWSIACTTIELLAGEPPFGKPEDHDGDMEPVFDKIRGYRNFSDLAGRLGGSAAWTSRSPDAKDFVQRLLHVNPDKRPAAIEALSHPWIVKHKPMRCCMTLDMAGSMAKYAAAPPLLRSCSLMIASRIGFAEQLRVGIAFVSADADDNGWLSREELVQALTSASVCGWRPPEGEARDIFAAVDLSRSGRLCFTEFAAACLFARHSRSVEQFAERAFGALDVQRKRSVSVQDILPLICEEARPCLADLPQDGSVSAQEWRTLVAAVAGGGSDVNADTTCSEEEEARSSQLLRMLSAIFCEQVTCSTCEQRFIQADDEMACDGYTFEPDPDMPETLVFQKTFAYQVV